MKRLLAVLLLVMLPLPALAARGTIYTQKRVALFVRNGQECYIPSDFVPASKGEGGIHDVARQLYRELDRRGISPFYSKTLLLSSATQAQVNKVAGRLARSCSPQITLNITRSTLPKDIFEFSLENKLVTSVRILVPKGNAYAESVAIANQLKAAADRLYPGLIQAVLPDEGAPIFTGGPVLTLQIGSVYSDKGRAFASLPMISESLLTALYGTEGAAGYYMPRSLEKPTAILFYVCLGITALCYLAALFIPKRLKSERAEKNKQAD